MSGHVDLREAVECGDVLGVDGFEGVEGHLEPPSFSEALRNHIGSPSQPVWERMYLRALGSL